jgi:MoxR-like ATPase
MSRVPEVAEELAVSIVRAVRALRQLDLRKAPSVAETIDWAQALLALGVTELTDDVVDQTLGVVLKHQSDRLKAKEQLRVGARS